MRPRVGLDSCRRKHREYGSCLLSRFWKLLLAVRAVRQVEVKLGEVPGIGTCVRLLPPLKWIRTAAQIQYEKGGAESEDHVGHFLLNCGDDELMEFIYPQRLGDIHRVEEIISHRLLGEKRKMQRDTIRSNRLSDPHRYESRITRRRDGRNDSTRQSESRRDNRRDDHRFDDRDRHEENRLVSRDI